jgi:hypothetical protein
MNVGTNPARLAELTLPARVRKEPPRNTRSSSWCEGCDCCFPRAPASASLTSILLELEGGPQPSSKGFLSHSLSIACWRSQNRRRFLACRALGTTMRWPQTHLPVRPAFSSGAETFLPHFGQVNRIMVATPRCSAKPTAIWLSGAGRNHAD